MLCIGLRWTDAGRRAIL